MNFNLGEDNMKKMCFTLLVVLIAVGIDITGAKGSSNGGGDTPVTTTIQGAGTDNALQIQSDGRGKYTSYSKRGDTVTSVIQSTTKARGDWLLDLTSSSLRRTTLDLTQPTSANNPAPPFMGAVIASRQISKCSSSNAVSFGNMLPGTSLQCPFTAEFTLTDGTSWRLVMNPANYPDTNWASVTCLTPVGQSTCKSWQITPSQPQNVAKLLQLSGQFGTPIADYGDYYISFQIDITNP